MVGVGGTNLDNDIDAYLAALRARQASNATQDTRRYHLRRFERWASRQQLSRPEQITRDAIERYLRFLASELGYKPASVQGAASSLKAWFTWMLDIGRVREVPRVPRIQVPIELPRVLAAEEIDAICSACDDGTACGARDRALIEFLWGSGCRIGEARALDLADLDLSRRRVRVMGKGRRQRIAILTPRATDALGHYIDRWRVPVEIPCHERAVFLSRAGRRISRSSAQEAIAKRGQRAGVGHVRPHLFRHSVATHLYDRGAGLRQVQELLGHVSVVSTQRYTHLSTSHLEKAMLTYHPRVS